LGGFIAGQAAAGEEVQRLARLAEAQAIYRDTVEVVSAAKDAVAIEPIKPEPDSGRWGRKRRRRGREGASEARDALARAPEAIFVVEPVIDARV
jgi:hypothetical protein